MARRPREGGLSRGRGRDRLSSPGARSSTDRVADFESEGCRFRILPGALISTRPRGKDLSLPLMFTIRPVICPGIAAGQILGLPATAPPGSPSHPPMMTPLNPSKRYVKAERIPALPDPHGERPNLRRPSSRDDQGLARANVLIFSIGRATPSPTIPDEVGRASPSCSPSRSPISKPRSSELPPMNRAASVQARFVRASEIPSASFTLSESRSMMTISKTRRVPGRRTVPDPSAIRMAGGSIFRRPAIRRRSLVGADLDQRSTRPLDVGSEGKKWDR